MYLSVGQSDKVTNSTKRSEKYFLVSLLFLETIS